MSEPSIGSTVRVKKEIYHPPKPWQKRRSSGSALTVARKCIVSSVDDGGISVVQDDLAPVPLFGDSFLIAPTVSREDIMEDDECEVVMSDIMQLLDFEGQDNHKVEDDTQDTSILVERYKDYGDQLLRINDYACAISYYEAALNCVSSQANIGIGSTIVVNRKGHCVIAEVDCVEDNNSYDVIFISDNEETTIAQKEILLAVWIKDVMYVQVKILLNLSRCLLKLADVDSNNRGKSYRQAAVLGCSIAITLCEYHALENNQSEQLDSFIEKARIVRSRAFVSLRKLPNATIDAKKVLCMSADNREAQSLLSEIKVIQAYTKSLDKKISKEIAKYVQSAMSSNDGTEAAEAEMNNNLVSNKGQSESTETKPVQINMDMWAIVKICAVLAVVFAIIMSR